MLMERKVKFLLHLDYYYYSCGGFFGAGGCSVLVRSRGVVELLGVSLWWQSAPS